ncbi:MAG: phage head morphogenesis protein, partial [Anaerolineae bacterium]|nr:phage head morphogenesis protein [Anaerolineae bacterium]
QELLTPAFDTSRADAIAVTEVTRAYAQAQRVYQDLLEREGLAMERVWYTMADDITCDICRALNRVVEENGEFFCEINSKTYDAPPAHVNCRCVTTLRPKR